MDDVPKASSPKVAASDVAAVVAAVAADLAGGVAVSVDAPLLDAGIDSIAAVEFVTTVQSAVGVPLDVSEVATLPTMGAIVERVTNAVARDLSVADDGMIKSLKPARKPPPALFLGAPAFGDGPLAYMKLVHALPLGDHPVMTLERDTTSTPWPEAARTHASRIATSQPDGIIAIGGHSLGGLLAVESAVCLETEHGREVSCFLFDAPHPVQFKSEWNDVPGGGANSEEEEEGANSNSSSSDDDEESTGLAYMEVALTSFHFDTIAAGWSGMTRDEKYATFEDVTFQATGRVVDARAMDEEISAGPYAAQWNSGIVRNEADGTCDVKAWKMLRGNADDEDDDDGGDGEKKNTKIFHRVRGKVTVYKASDESSALFETDLQMEHGGAVLRSVSGYAWALACDHLEIVHCQGSHMNLMTPEEDGGDLVRSIQKFFTHRSVSTFDRSPFQLTGELFLYGMALRRTRSRRI
jgi:thioesterase domain-containing protein/acyl carrier protein